MIVYRKLFALLESRGIKPYPMFKCIFPNSPQTVWRLQNDKPASTDTIDKICEHLDCQPGSIMEYVKNPDKKGGNG